MREQRSFSVRSSPHPAASRDATPGGKEETKERSGEGNYGSYELN